MPFWTIPKETATMILMLMDMLHPNVTKIMWKVTGREVIYGIAFRSQPGPKWPIQLSVHFLVEVWLQAG